MTALNRSQLDAYLSRVGHSTTPEASIEGLRALVTAHQVSVPFENLSVLLGIPIDLETDYLFAKIVHGRRGGYCFENNGLFLAVLLGLGFSAYPVMCRVWYGLPNGTPGNTHTLNIVTIDGEKWLVDVGFGGTTPREPVRLAAGETTDQDGGLVLAPHPAHGWMLSRNSDSGLLDQFSFHDAPAFAADCEIANFFMSCHPTSKFVTALRMSRFTMDGRISLLGNALVIRRGGDNMQQTISPEALPEILAEHFGINLGDDYRRLERFCVALSD